MDRAERASPPPPEFRLIFPRHEGGASRLAEFWRARRMIPFFARRLIEKLYVRTWLGWLWLPLRPTLQVSSQAFVFGGILAVPSNGIPYLLFLLAGMPVWNLFTRVAYWATRSIELNRRYLTRLYLPRLVLLVAAVGPGLVTFAFYIAIAVVIVIGYLIADGTTYLEPSAQTLLIPVGLALAIALALAMGLFTSIYGAQARDVRFGLNYVFGFWYLLTPVIYPLSAVPEGYRTVAELNPMTAPVEMIRLGLFDIGSVPTTSVIVSCATVFVVGVAGLSFFLRSEAQALDHL